MDDSKIKENFPKGWELFLFHSGLRKAWHPFDDPKWYRQYLYDFFDEQEIAVEIGIDLTLEAKYCFKIAYLVDGDWKLAGIADWSDLYLRRHEAEEAAFMEAFAVFEKQLTPPYE